MKLYQTVKRTARYWTREQRKFKLPWLLLFGRGLNGDRSNTASSPKKRGGRDE
ncbi:hypothetical protein FACS1894109_11140 [Spirochaetia bacterium]|nr:hypothetical protein FACS1894109_11140 [Spirochaetia bacterium]